MFKLESFLYNNIIKYYFCSLIILISFIINKFINYGEFLYIIFFVCLFSIYFLRNIFSYFKLISFGIIISLIGFQFKYYFFIFIFFINFIFIIITPIYFKYLKEKKYIFRIFYILLVLLYCYFYNNIYNFELNTLIYNYLCCFIISLYILFLFDKNELKIKDMNNFNFLFLKYF